MTQLSMPDPFDHRAAPVQAGRRRMVPATVDAASARLPKVCPMSSDITRRRHSVSEMILGPPYHRYGHGPALWSIKGYGGGAVPFEVDRQKFLVNDEICLFVNSGQYYEFSTPAQSTLFNFTIFLTDGDLRDAWASHCATEESLLANAGAGGPEVPEFMAVGLRIPEPIRRLRASLRNLWEVGAITSEIVNAGASHIVAAAIASQAEAISQTRKVNAVRSATREEAVRRIRRAAEYIDSDICASLDLDRLAAVACMAKYHFLRRFRDIMGVTPYQFVLSRRIENAARLLMKAEACIAEVGRASGFADPASFSVAFRSHKGLPPGKWRRAQLGNYSKGRDDDNRPKPG